ncbi:hypothetical protein K461DRAFT_174396 [Myriangium duriaei CBS 260.36]|uniref:AA1-like domain-containing protein n=1 Tax=Myriangium duriaei CBS 260.36 TaxID=1168546 RepID=A0A9P4J1E4_9PEZI|nr:hypothetical protein K461DRAFT_174396 [Myriangium duriaei CBS 260.36]
MIFDKSSLLSLLCLTASSLAKSTENTPSSTVSGPRTLTTFSVVTMTATSSSSTGTPAGNWTLKNFVTEQRFGLTTLSFDFSDTKSSAKGTCATTLTHRYESDSCGNPSNYFVNINRTGNGQWPLNITMNAYLGQKQPVGVLSLIGPGKQGISCSTTSVSTICKAKAPLMIEYSYQNYYVNGA